MRIWNTSRARAERGSAVVEFAIVATTLVPILLYSLYFVDLAKARLKTAEIARYAVWEMTSYPLTDYKDKNHDDFFDDAADDVAKDIQHRYADDLRADTIDKEHKPWPTVDYQLSAVEFENQEANLVPNPDAYSSSGGGGGIVDTILSNVSGGINDVLGFWGFNKKGQAKVTVTLQTTVRRDVIVEQYSQEFNEAKLLPEEAGTQTFTEDYTMIVDSWTLFDGDDVYPYGGYAEGNDDSIYYKQLKRVVWMGLGEAVPFMDGIGSFLDKLNSFLGGFIDLNPPKARLASVASRGDAANAANVRVVNVDCGEGKDLGIHTTPMQETFGGPADSEYGKTYMKRGDYYMGCPEAQQKPGKCPWKE